METSGSAMDKSACILLSGPQLAEVCQYFSSPTAASLHQLLSVSGEQAYDGVQVWAALRQTLCHRDDRLVLLSRCPLLVPPLLHRLTVEDDSDDTLLFSVVADVLRVAAPLAGYVREVVLQSSEEPWLSVLSHRHRQKRRRFERDTAALLGDLLTVAVRLPHVVRYKWRLSSLVARLRQMSVDRDGEEMCWLVCRLVATVAGMADSQWKYWMNTMRISRTSDITNANRYFPTSRLSQNIISASYSETDSAIDIVLSSNDTGSRLVCVEGVFLPVVDSGGSEEQLSPALVPVPSLRDSLRSAALALATGRPLLLEGPVGCGKSTLARHLASLTGRHRFPRLVTVQMTEQVDCKLFVGEYRCTEVPGQFVWRDGCLVAAMQAGDWLLLEDIDAAPADVLALLLPVLERRQLPGSLHGNSVRAAAGFRLMATQRLETSPDNQLHRRRPLKLAGCEQLWSVVSMEPLSSSELQTVLVTRWPPLAPVADRLLQVFVVASRRDDVGQGCVAVRETRVVSTRDLMKWCSRFGDHYDDSSAECAYSVFQHACDLFCSAFSSDELRRAKSQQIAVYLGITPDQVSFMLSQHKPSISARGSTLTVGRCQMYVSPEVRERSRAVPPARFSLTRAASVLLERVAVAVSHAEPVLLIGETGVGKTSVVQTLAARTGQRLLVINLSQQSDSGDLLGGHKPVGVKQVMTPVRVTFELLFRQTFDSTANAKFLHHITVLFAAERWADLCDMMLQVQKKAVVRLKQKMPSDQVDSLLREWVSLSERVSQLRLSVKKDMALAFAFVEGALVEALRGGWWVLLDEINLASDDALSCVAGVLDSETLTFLESGDTRSVQRHEHFRLFACMNPATDVGKHQLPAGLRNRFTELFVDQLESDTDLCLLVGDYLHHLGMAGARIEGVVQLYQAVRREARDSLADGAGNRPNYSLRTLCRALAIAAANPCGHALRSLYEALCTSFLTQLSRSSYPLILTLIEQYVLPAKMVKSIRNHELPAPPSGRHVQVEGYWIRQGDLTDTDVPTNYILTDCVRNNLRDICRTVALGNQPVLLQGHTSVGKTSMITYLAALTANKCVRINNHEHTDLQEYVGTYCADTSGKLVFQEGVLIDAMRRGYWIILDELNLAPTDVLEALNRLLDDNRQLYITETQTNIRAHPGFRLFATQNPPGQYAGRKVLSRAFRNRFVELHFDDIPCDELITILHQRSQIPLSYAKKMTAVLKDLQVRRRCSDVFRGKQGFITLRDLFRWAERYRLADPQTVRFYDWDQHLADEGYIILAGRVRRRDECTLIAEILQKHFKCSVDEHNLFSLHEKTSAVTRTLLTQLEMYRCSDSRLTHMVWTFCARRLYVLLTQAMRFREPVLLVGETGCGKTSVCQFFAALQSLPLRTVNCHLHSESADFLGGLRPVRERSDTCALFEWVDGPLVEAMRAGECFLVDEISLADDSVLERLNSVLEPQRSLVLCEKASDHPDVILAVEQFRFVATMNPAGDHGKKELSPALRNRFTEIWCPAPCVSTDLYDIAMHNIICKDAAIVSNMVQFIEWFSSTDFGRRTTVSIRDLLGWVSFFNSTHCSGEFSMIQAYVHGAHMVFLDAIGCQTSAAVSNGAAVKTARDSAVRFISSQFTSEPGPVSLQWGEFVDNQAHFGYRPFLIEKSSVCADVSERAVYAFSSPTTSLNLKRVLRALRLKKPIMLEGSPGVGKTSLVCALAAATCNSISRINLSEQTDVSDLFGADLPVEGGVGGTFAWRDGPFLRALRRGDWIVLDEMNLASQSVLEGLNACFDHRGEVFIPELGRTFTINNEATRIFACQNPAVDGGARKSLPKSFLNRFTQVFVEPLTPSDYEHIIVKLFPDAVSDVRLRQMVELSGLVTTGVDDKQIGRVGGPWEFNLRDLVRWCQIMTQTNTPHPFRHLHLFYMERLRSVEDRQVVSEFVERVFGESYCRPPCHFYLNDASLEVGSAVLARSSDVDIDTSGLCLLQSQLPTMESLIHCVNQRWMAIVVGSSGAGKTSLVRCLAALAGKQLQVVTMSPALDTTELLGGFEQADQRRRLETLIQHVEAVGWRRVRQRLISAGDRALPESACLLQRLENLSRLSYRHDSVQLSQTQIVDQFMVKCDAVEDVLSVLDGVDGLFEQLQLLRATVARDAGVNAGGVFEWVDSVLVRALANGEWLLIDNVNLCPASVMDRLNGVLEPGGVLELSERGVVDDRVVTVTPHPDFRLFLAMNPAHGEISRAMRNRGVEIFMEDISQHVGFGEDLKCLLAQRHIGDGNRALSPLMELTVSLESACRTSSGSVIRRSLNSAELVSQLVCRQVSLSSAVRGSYTGEFVRCHSHPHSKPPICQAIDTCVVQCSDPNSGSVIAAERWKGDVTMSLTNLQWNPYLVLARKLWSAIVWRLEHADLETAAVFLRYSFLHCSSDSFELIRHYVVDHGSSLSNVISVIECPSERPLALSVMPCCLWPSADESTLLDSCADIMSIFIQFALADKKALEVSFDQSTVSNRNIKSQLGFSLAINRGSIKLGNRPACLRLLWPVCHFVDQLLQVRPPTNFVILKLWLEALCWRQRFYNVCCQCPNVQEVRVWVSMVGLHWMWLKQHLICPILTEFPTAFSTQSSIITEMDSCFSANSCQLTMLAEKVHQQILTPQPLENSQIAESLHDLQQLDWAVDLYLHHKPADGARLNSVSSLIRWLVSAHGVIARQRLVEAFRNVFTGNESVDDVRSFVHSSLVSAGVMVGQCSTPVNSASSDSSSDRLLSSVDFSVVLAVVKKLELPYVSALLESQQQHDYFTSLQHMIQYTCLSPEYIALRGVVSSGNDFLKINLSNALLQLIVSDPALCRWRDSDDGDDYRGNVDEIDAHLHSAQLSAILTEALTSSQPGSNQLVLSIQQCFERRQSLVFLKTLLWKVRPLFFEESSYMGKLLCQWAISIWSDFTRQLLSQLSDNETPDFCMIVQSADCLPEQYRQWLLETNRRVSCIESTLLSMGSVFVKLGVSQLFLLSHLPQVDHIQQKRLALEYSSNEISAIRRELEVGQSVDRIATGLNMPSNTDLFDSPIVCVQKQRIKELQESIDRSGSRQSTWRPPAAHYEELKSHIANFVSTVGSINSIADLLKTVENVSCDDPVKLNFTAQQLTSRLISLSVFIASLRSGFWAYPDLITPIVSALQNIRLGVATLLSACRRWTLTCRLPQCLVDVRTVFLEFFSWIRCRPISVHCSQLSALIKTLALFDDRQITGNWKLMLLETAVSDLSSRLAITGSVNLAHVSQLVHEICSLWTSQELQRQQSAEQSESLYKTKTYCDNTVEDEDQSLKEMFPDFSGVYDDSESETPPSALDGGCSTRSPIIADLSVECLANTLQLASSTFDVCANPSWCQVEPVEHKDQTIASFRLRYQFFSAISSHLSTFLEPQDDGEMSITHHMVIDSITSSFDARQGDVSTGICNPYHDSNPSCVIGCRSLLVDLRSAVDSLLNQWSENPALLQLRKSVQCVLDLEVTSPLVKVTMGLEFILQKAQVWEEVAHKGVSLSEILYKITDIVLKWRKLELDSWKSCLSSSADRKCRNSVLWMPKLHALFEESGQSQETVDQLSSALQTYLETSPLGEFCARLKLLLFFHKKLTREQCCRSSRRPNHVVSVTWNVYRYYSQFQQSVQQHIDSLKKPIEKKIVDFVKISRWNDVNFWSVKETVKRSHQFLHKQIKEFESVLDQTVSPLLCQSDSEHFEIESVHCQINRETARFLIDKKRESLFCPFSESRRLSRLDRVTKIARRLCVQTYKQCDVMSAVEPLNQLAETICCNMNEFNSLNLESIEDKQKRLKEAAHVRQCKRQALQELFRTLKSFGLSFRRGLVQWSSSSDVGVSLFSTPPLSRFECGLMSDLRSGCEQYECRSVSRFSFLRTCSTQPHKEVDAQYLERIPGFSSDFLSFIIEQKEQLTDISRDVQILSNIHDILQETCVDSESLSFSIKPFDVDVVTRVVSYIGDSVMLCHRLELFLSSAPDIAANDDCPGISVFGTSALISGGISSKECSEMRKLLEESRSYLVSAQSCLNTIVSNDLCLSSLKFRLTMNSNLKTVVNVIARILTSLRSESSGIYIPFYDRFQEIYSKIKEVNICLIDSGSEHSPDSDNVAKEVLFVKHCENIVGLVQISLQEIKKVNLTTEWEESNDNCIQTIRNELHDLFTYLNVPKVIVHLRKLIRLLTNSVFSNTSSVKLVDTITAFLPLLRQYEMLCKYVVTSHLYFYRVSTKTASIIFRVFGEVLRKGFCTPPDLETSDDQENEGQVLDVSEGGLGEGQGSKDVSDKIESEDQLEGAHRPGEHDKESNEDVKEEEKGIEMHDDFAGKMQDITEEDRGSDGSESEEQEDDLDKQMGDVDGFDEEKIDDRLWGDDQGDEEELDDDEESGGTGNEGAQIEAKSDNEKYQKEPRKKTKVEENEYSEDEDQQKDDYHNNFPQAEAAPELNIPDNMDVDEAGENGDEDSDEGSCPEDVERRPNYPPDDEVDKGEQERDLDEVGDGTDDADASDNDFEGKGIETEKEDTEENNVDDLDDNLDSQVDEDTAPVTENQVQPEKDRSGCGAQPIDNEVDVESAGVQHQSKPLKDAQESFGMAETLDGGREVSDGKFAVDRTEFRQEDCNKLNKHPRSTDSERSLAREEDKAKPLTSVETFDTVENRTADGMDCDETGADAFQHIKDTSEKYDALVADAATDDQLKAQQDSEEDQPEQEHNQPEDVDMNEEATENDSKLEKMETNNIQERRKETDDNSKRNKGNKGDDISVPGAFIQTATVSRPLDAHLSMNSSSVDNGLIDTPLDILRNMLELHVDAWSKYENGHFVEIEKTWQQYETLVDPLARELSEQLRLILEPTQCSKLTGDYRTGKRLNMRKVIPYIASQFRKDKIWLRRSRPSKRDYQIVLAVDDSSSMSDNHSRQLAFETLALAGKAFHLVEAGRLAVVSFGEQTRLLCDLDRERSMTSFGNQLLRQLTFAQSRTNVADMLSSVHRLLSSRSNASSGAVSQLLLVVSDGRGLFHEGEQTVRAAVRQVRHSGVFLLFIIIDSPQSQSSVLDHRVVRFGSDGKVIGTDSYLDSFPFPYYMVLRDINSLPNVLSDALRQWFELVTSVDR